MVTLRLPSDSRPTSDIFKHSMRRPRVPGVNERPSAVGKHYCNHRELGHYGVQGGAAVVRRGSHHTRRLLNNDTVPGSRVPHPTCLIVSQSKRTLGLFLLYSSTFIDNAISL
ncbi:hypothetical protein E2C01_027070 [Portunus trituberculatus]|uniref:Uncharacterized protein n=1 Tax=Portunus trituberculatus TaxID=210409 RepID=A0A5B7EGY6_PORTR|nr:hypothetical protein [Portunus trituberculatus]